MDAAVTASQIARALNRTPRGIRKALARIEPVGLTLVQGKKTAVWALNQLPSEMRESLAAVANARGYKGDVMRLLHHPPRSWKPVMDGKEISLNEIAPHCLEDAQRLQRALVGILPMVVKGSLPNSEIAAIGLRDYRSEMGHEITEAHWWRLVHRTLDRDAGAMEFARVEIFLSDQLARKETRPVGYSAAAASLDVLSRWLQAVKVPHAPTPDEAKMVWDAAFLEVESLVETGLRETKARRLVVEALAKSGVHLAKSPGALKRNFDRKFARWIAEGGKPSAIADRRPARSGHRRAPELSEEDRLTIIARAVENGGRIAQGWREALRSGELSAETTQRFIQNPGRKSHVPRSIREAVSDDVRRLSIIHHGPREHRLKGAYVSRDHSDCAAADWFQADDVTLNHYYYEDTPEGRVAMRGQCLLFIDVRTNYILHFALHSERNYNARIIREAITRVHDTYGLPRHGFYFERGIWQSARILTGQKGGFDVPFEVTEEGLREFVKFKHARTPRAKVIERVIGMLQNETEALPGYVGRNEILDRYERIQKQLLQARSGKLAYEKFLMSKAQWVDLLERVCDRYNTEPQEGKLRGLSPREAYEALFNYADPLTRLGPDQRFLLANHRKPLRVTRNGIRLLFAGESIYYRNEATGKLAGQDVLVWYSTEEAFPDSITITDLNMRNPIEVPRELKPPSMSASADELKAAIAQAESHNKYARTLYRTITPRFQRNKEMFRQLLPNEYTKDLGEQIATARKKTANEQNKRAAVTRKIRKHEQERGMQPTPLIRNPERKLRGLETLAALEKNDQQKGEA